MDSAFFHLVESIETPAKLFLHQYAKKTYLRTWNDYLTKHRWTAIT
jgi:hypothetical protein